MQLRASGGPADAARYAAAQDAAWAGWIQLFRGGQPAEGTETVHAAAAQGVATPSSPLPYADPIRRAFGHHDISSVQAHTGPEAAASARAMGADAYATGNHIVLGGSTDLHTVAHEAAHIVQQRGGVQLKGGVGAEGDQYEQHADAVADAVVSGKSAAPLLDQMSGSGHGEVAVQRAPAMPSSGTGGAASEITPPTAGIDKPGFIDNSDGANIRTGPAEAGGKTVRDQPLPPATRVFVSGTHPSAPEWWYVTAHLDGTMVRGYVQHGRVNTDLPEPTAKLHQVVSGDTAEKLAAREYGSSVRDGHDLRYYENVLLYVNQQHHHSAGITGTYQDPGLLGGGGNNVQLVAGHRIWLISPAYAKALEGVVPDGSLTGGAVAKVKRFAGHLQDILHSVTESRNHFGEVAGELAQAIRDHMAEIIGITAGFLMAEATSMFLAAAPTGVSQAAAAVIQLALAAFGAAGMVQASVEALKHGTAWLTTAWTAHGKSELIAEASKEFLRMLVAIAMAALSYAGAKGNLRNAVKIGNSIPTAGLPAFATAAGRAPSGANAAAGVAIGAGPGPGAFGVGGALMVKHESEGGHAETSPGEARPVESSELPPRKPFKTKEGSVVEVVEQGRAVVPTGKVEVYLRGKAKPFTPEMTDELRGLKHERQVARKVFDASPEKAARIELLERLQHNHQRSLEMSNSLTDAGLPNTGPANAEILQHLLEVGQQINEGNRARFRSELAGAQGRVKLLSTWILLPDGRVLLSSLNVIPQ